jgi:hypothetical protein
VKYTLRSWGNAFHLQVKKSKAVPQHTCESDCIFLKNIYFKLQVAVWFPKTVLREGAWKILKVKGGLSKKVWQPLLSVHPWSSHSYLN